VEFNAVPTAIQELILRVIAIWSLTISWVIGGVRIVVASGFVSAAPDNWISIITDTIPVFVLQTLPITASSRYSEDTASVVNYRFRVVVASGWVSASRLITYGKSYSASVYSVDTLNGKEILFVQRIVPTNNFDV
jgi:hypothetical protein